MTRPANIGLQLATADATICRRGSRRALTLCAGYKQCNIADGSFKELPSLGWNFGKP